MKNIFVILSLISLLFIASSCPKNPDSPTNNPQLPPATQTGANTFGCLLNGKIWLPSGNSGLPSLIAQYYRGDFTIAVKRNGNPDGAQSLSWAYKPIFKPGIYYFKSKYNDGYPAVMYGNILTSCSYATEDNDSLQNQVTITKLDSVNRIISGTFNLYFLPTSNDCDTIRITSGRFDTKYTD